MMVVCWEPYETQKYALWEYWWVFNLKVGDIRGYRCALKGLHMEKEEDASKCIAKCKIVVHNELKSEVEK
jgi:hypothetical protein